jgi:integrase
MEVVALKVSDIDSKRMMLRVEQGKGKKNLFAMLSPQLSAGTPNLQSAHRRRLLGSGRKLNRFRRLRPNRCREGNQNAEACSQAVKHV